MAWNYCVTRKEMLAMAQFIRYFHSYLLGHSITVRTDHAALKWLQLFKKPEGQVMRWLEQLQEYKFTTQH